MATRTLTNLSAPQLLTELRNREDNLQNAQMAATVAADERNEVVLELSRREFRNSQIAVELGISPTRVGQIIERARAREVAVAA